MAHLMLDWDHFYLIISDFYTFFYVVTENVDIIIVSCNGFWNCGVSFWLFSGLASVKY
jgi:hypothetical protein